MDDGIVNNHNTAYFNVTTYLMGKDVSDDYPNDEVPIRKVESTIINEDNVHDIIQTGVSQPRENSAWKAMAVRSRADMRRRRKPLIESGCNRSIFTNRSLFTEFSKCLIPITTAGEEIYATGMGTVGNLKGCLYVADMNVNLISVMHVLDDIPNVLDEKPKGVRICIIRHKLQQFQEVTFESKSRLFEVSDYTWLGLLDLDDNEMWEQYHVKANKMRASYFTGIKE